VEALQAKMPEDAAIRRNVAIILEQIDRIVRTMHGMLDFARARDPRLAPLEVTALLREVIEFLQPRFERKGIAVSFEAARAQVHVSADRDQLSQVFLNLALNAIDAMPEGGRLKVALGVVERRHPHQSGAEPATYAEASWSDSGHGISSENLERIFDPFFTTKEVGAGAGLGLSIAYGIVQEHGGWISVESDPGSGTRVGVYLPLEGSVAGRSANEETA
jgi:signal transduction histidine kinase